MLCTKMTLSLLFTKSITVFVEWLSKDKLCLLMKLQKGNQSMPAEGEAEKKMPLNHPGNVEDIGGARFLRTSKVSTLRRQLLSMSNT